MAENNETCPVCGSEVSPDSETCPECGMDLSFSENDEMSEDEEIEEEITFECPICGEQVSEEDTECPNCGALFESEEEEEVEELEERDLMEGIKEIKDLFTEIKDTQIDSTLFKEDLKQLVKAAKEEKFSEGNELLEKLNRVGDIILETDELVTEIKDEFKDLPESKLSEYREDLKKVMNKSESGDYEESHDIAQDLLEKIREFSKESGELEEELEDKLGKARKHLAKARDIKIKIDVIKDNIREAVQAKNSGNFEKAIDKAEKVINLSNKANEAFELILEGKEKVKELKNKEMDFESHLRRLKKSKKIADKGNYSEAIEELQKNISEMDQTLEGIEEIEDLENVFEEKINKARKILKETRDLKLDEEPIKEKVRQSISEKDEGNYERGIEIAEEIIELYDKIKESSEKLNESEEKIQELKEKSLEFEDLANNIDEGKRLADNGDYSNAIKIFNDSIQEIESRLKKFEEEVIEEDIEEETEITESKEEGLEVEEDLGLEEGADVSVETEEFEEEIIEEEDVSQEKEEIEEERDEDEVSEEKIEEMVQKELEEAEEMISGGEMTEETKVEEESQKVKEELEEIKTSKEVEEEIDIQDIERKVSEIRSLLLTARDYEIIIESGREVINEVLKSTESKDYNRAYNALQYGKSQVETELKNEIEDKLIDLELFIEEEKDNKEIGTAQELFKDARKGFEDENYRKSLKLILDTREEIEEARSKKEITEDKISDNEDIVLDTESLGIDVKESKELIKKSKEEFDKENYNKAVDLAKEAKEKALEKIPSIIDDYMKEAQNDLTKAKIVGIDVSRPIDLLKQANLAKKNDNYENCLHYMKMYEDEMDERME